MLNLCGLVYVLLDLNWVLIDLCAELSCYFDLFVSLLYVVLDQQEHCLVACEEDLVLVCVHVFGRYSMAAHIGRIDDTETVLNENGLVKYLPLTRDSLSRIRF